MTSYHSISKLILITFFAIVTFSCSKDDDGIPPVVITELSQDIKKIIYFRGDEKAPKVLITVPGGPSTKLGTDIVDEISTDFNTTDILNITVHQAQTLDSTIVKGNDITLTQANTFNTESIEMLSKVITYFKDQGRTVYVLGVSFGAFIAQDLIAKKGIDAADKYLIMLGRLDMNDIIWQAAAEGRDGYFENSIIPKVDAEPLPDVKERNLTRIGAGFLMNRYTQLLSPIEDLSNLTYIYGKTDNAVGRLTASEVTFLQSKNANILSGPGGHEEPFVDFVKRGFKDAFGIEATQ